MLHRRVTIADFSADPFWSRTQTAPAPPGLVEPIRISNGTKILWWGIGYNGNDANAKPVDSTTLTFDAALVYALPGSLQREYVRLPSYKDKTTVELEAGMMTAELDLPHGVEAWLQVLAITAGTSPASHLWLSYDFRRAP